MKSTERKQIWVIGPQGQLGSYLIEQLGTKGVAIGRDRLELADADRVATALDEQLEQSSPPRWVINATAYNQVDKAETEQELCDQVNATAPTRMAQWCARHGAGFVHYSTDYVFSGEGDQAWHEDSPTHPLSHYGRSKLNGEIGVQEAFPAALIFRTSWVYSHFRDCFVSAILKRARTGGELKVVEDQVGSPTSAEFLARYTLQILAAYKGGMGGVYHLTDAGYVSRLDFARAIIATAAEYEPTLSTVKIQPIQLASLESAAKRPLNTRLALDKVQSTFGIAPAPWQEGLKHCIRRMNTKADGVRDANP